MPVLLTGRDCITTSRPYLDLLTAASIHCCCRSRMSVTICCIQTRQTHCAPISGLVLDASRIHVTKTLGQTCEVKPNMGTVRGTKGKSQSTATMHHRRKRRTPSTFSMDRKALSLFKKKTKRNRSIDFGIIGFALQTCTEEYNIRKCGE